jgi:hypothetical protein
MGMNAAVLFYTDGVTESDASRVATFLVAAGLLNHWSNPGLPTTPNPAASSPRSSIKHQS